MTGVWFYFLPFLFSFTFTLFSSLDSFFCFLMNHAYSTMDSEGILVEE